MATNIYSFTVEGIDGKDINLSQYEGRVLIIVNVASAAEHTERDYEQLQELYEKYKDGGLRVIGFPCNQFDGKEPKSNAAIRVFAKKRGVTFDMAAKVDVNGDDAIPLYQFIRTHENTCRYPDNEIAGNFTKYVVDRNGIPRRRADEQEEPSSLEGLIEVLLNE